MGNAQVSRLNHWDKLFVGWAFFFQLALIVHFALRKRFYDTYTLKYGWLVYALCIPAATISIFLLLRGKAWFFWISGFLFVGYAAYGYWVDYIKHIPWRKPFHPPVGVPYLILHLATVMFYWWPLGRIGRGLWLAYGVLFAIAMVLNVLSH